MQCRCPSFFFFPQKRQRLGSKDLRGEMSLLHHFPSCLGFSERGVQWNPTPVATFSSERDTHRAWDRLSVQRCRVASQLCNLTHLLHRVHPYKYTDTEKKQNTKGGGNSLKLMRAWMRHQWIFSFLLWQMWSSGFSWESKVNFLLWFKTSPWAANKKVLQLLSLNGYVTCWCMLFF